MRKCPGDVCSCTNSRQGMQRVYEYTPSPADPKALQSRALQGGGGGYEISCIPENKTAERFCLNGLKSVKTLRKIFEQIKEPGTQPGALYALEASLTVQTRGTHHAHYNENRPRGGGSSINWNGWEIGYGPDRRHAGSDQRRGHGCSPGSEDGLPRTSLWLAPRTSLWLVSSSWLLTFGLDERGGDVSAIVASRWQRSVDDGEIRGAKVENNALREQLNLARHDQKVVTKQSTKLESEIAGLRVEIASMKSSLLPTEPVPEICTGR